MARGDVKVFASFDLKAKSGVSFNLASDTIKLGIVNNSTVPSVSTADPRWGAGGSTNFSSNDCAHATAYTGPITLTSVTFTRSNGVVTFDADNITVALDAAGFTDGYWGIIYDDTVSGKYAIAFVDLGGPVSLAAGALNINFNASGIFADTAS